MGFPFPIKTWIQKNKHYFITILEGMREENFFSVDKVVWDYDLLNEKVVYGLRGTGKSANPKIEGLNIAGKTGTSENPHGEPHAWFIGFGEKDGKQVSLVLLVENSGHGGEVAAPKARRIFSEYFNRSEIKMAEAQK